MGNKRKSVKDVVKFIQDNNITEYAELMDVIMDAGEGMVDYFDIASSHTLFFKSYIASRRHSRGAPFIGEREE